MKQQPRSKLTVLDPIVAELKEIRKETHTGSYSKTIKWLLDHRIEAQTIDRLKEIMHINEYTSLSDTVEHLINELMECLEGQEEHKD